MSRRWVADASPISLLAKTGRIDLLLACTEELLVPEAVAEEVRQASADDTAREWLETKGETFVETNGTVAKEVAAWDLGRGDNHILLIPTPIQNGRRSWTTGLHAAARRAWRFR